MWQVVIAAFLPKNEIKFCFKAEGIYGWNGVVVQKGDRNAFSYTSFLLLYSVLPNLANFLGYQFVGKFAHFSAQNCTNYTFRADFTLSFLGICHV